MKRQTDVRAADRAAVFFCLSLLCLLCPRLGGIKRSSASVVRPSVCLMSRTSALTRKPKGLGRRNFAQGYGYPRPHATPTPTSRSKGQRSRSRGGGILWRPRSRTACYHCWAGCCECATAVQFFKVTELLCLVGNKSSASAEVADRNVTWYVL